MTTLTPAQEKIVQAIARSESNGTPLFVPELVQKLGYAAESSLTPTLKILQRKGVIEIVGGGNHRAYRLIRLSKTGRAWMGVGCVPLLGSIPAGPLAEAVSDVDEYVEVDSLLKVRRGDFLLRAAGDSMIGDGILDGDLVLLRPQPDFSPGEIAAIYAGDRYESTLKHVVPETDGVRLKASNPAYPDILIPQSEWKGIAGVFRGLVRHVAD